MSQAAITRSSVTLSGLAKSVWSICFEMVYETLKFRPLENCFRTTNCAALRQ
jgi:hypothetical protein